MVKIWKIHLQTSTVYIYLTETKQLRPVLALYHVLHMPFAWGKL